MPSLYETFSGGLTPKEHREQTRLEAAQRRTANRAMRPRERLHRSLDWIGSIESPVSPAADIVNAGLYAVEGDKSKSLWSLLYAAPLVGGFVKQGRRLNSTQLLSRATDTFRMIKARASDLDDPTIYNNLLKIEKSINDFYGKRARMAAAGKGGGKKGNPIPKAETKFAGELEKATENAVKSDVGLTDTFKRNVDETTRMNRPVPTGPTRQSKTQELVNEEKQRRAIESLMGLGRGKGKL